MYLSLHSVSGLRLVLLAGVLNLWVASFWVGSSLPSMASPVRANSSVNTLPGASEGSGADEFVVDLWPEEGRPVFAATTTTTLELRQWPAPTAPIVARMPVAKGDPIVFGETRYQSLRPGRLRVLAAADIQGRSLGVRAHLSLDDYYSDRFPTITQAVLPGETIEFLLYRAEGTCFIRIRDNIIDADYCPIYNDDVFQLESEPEIAWWIQVFIDGKPQGWLSVTNNETVQEVQRLF